MSLPTIPPETYQRLALSELTATGLRRWMFSKIKGLLWWKLLNCGIYRGIYFQVIDFIVYIDSRLSARIRKPCDFFRGAFLFQVSVRLAIMWPRWLVTE